MNETETRRSGHGGAGIALAFLGGALAGAGVALLLAPRSGADTRRRITDKVHDSTDHVKRARLAASEAVTAAHDAFNAAMQEKH